MPNPRSFWPLVRVGKGVASGKWQLGGKSGQEWPGTGKGVARRSDQMCPGLFTVLAARIDQKWPWSGQELPCQGVGVGILYRADVFVCE